MRVSVSVSVWVICVSVSVWVISVRVSVKVSARVGVRISVRVRTKVVELLHFVLGLDGGYDEHPQQAKVQKKEG